jgi:single-stranded-DNA-specific exonuclease
MTMREWLDPKNVTVPDNLGKAVGGHPLIAEHLMRKGIITPDAVKRFLSADNYTPASPNELPDMDKAVDRLNRAIKNKESVLVWGDFDVDGQTSTALLVSALQKLGARVNYHVPNRFTEGHGIHLETLKTYLDGGIDLLVTCDTGISAHDAIDYSNSRGVDVVITDHHALPEAWPNAYAVINPRRLQAGHPLIELPGVGTAYKVVEALYKEESTDFLLDLVAMGIVADVMVQVDDTRYLLQRGLDVLRENNRIGLRAMLEKAEIQPQDINEGHIGFTLAPRLNAMGRLGDANPSVEVLITDDWERARILANNLEGLNSQRKFLSNQVYQSAVTQIESDPSLLEYAVIVLSHDEWHTGVVGIVASRLVELYGLPVVLFATPDEVGRGSARSVAGVDITEAIGQVQRHVIRFGGHTMAAGMSLPKENIFTFRRELSQVVRVMLGDVEIKPTLAIDGYIGLDDISLELTQDIERLAPFGNGNPPLVLATRNVKIASRSQLGRRGDHLQLRIEDEQGNRQKVVWWRGAGQSLPMGQIDLAYTVRTSTYKGNREAMVEWLDYRQLETTTIDLDQSAGMFEIIDYRQSDNPLADVDAMLKQYPDTVIWSEVDKSVDGVGRLNLSEAETLIVWTVPPEPTVWKSALDTVNPSRLILFGLRPDVETSAKFMTRLIGLVKYTLNNRAGEARLEELAVAMGHRDLTVQVGLQVLRAMGKINYKISPTGTYQLTQNDQSPTTKLEMLQHRLELLLCETKAYRDYWLEAVMTEKD